MLGPTLAGGWRISRSRTLVLIGLFAALLVMLVVIPPGQDRLPTLTTYSASPTGAKGLWLWLRELGYQIGTVETARFQVPDRTATLAVLAPWPGLRDDELDLVEKWVRDGGMLLIAGEGPSVSRAFERFGVRARIVPRMERATPGDEQLLNAAIQSVLVDTIWEIAPGRVTARPFLTANGHVVGGSIAVGLGRVLALTSEVALSNQGLRERDNARLAISLLGPPARGRIVFDEFHHGYGAGQARSLLTLLLDRSWGKALLFAALLVFLYVLLCGRRFGRPIPAGAPWGRSLSEYVESLAALYRAGGKRAFIARHFQQRLRADLAHDLGLPADASLERLGERADMLGREVEPTLWSIERLGSADVGEAELVRLVRDGERALAAARGRTAITERASG
jgi:hypothetical protein